MLSAAHVHTQFCDGKSSAEELVVAAIENKMQAIGFTSHGVQDFDAPYCMTEQGEVDYKREIARLRQRYAPYVTVWCGVERDSQSSSKIGGYDYWIASNHYFYFGKEDWTPVNASLTDLQSLLKRYSVDQLLEHYFAEVVKAATLRPSFIGHFDLVKRINDFGELVDLRSNVYLGRARAALRAIRESVDLIELNTSMITRRGVEYSYPEQELLSYWRSIGGKVIITTDCHDVQWLTSGYEQGVEIARRVGYKEVVNLGRDKLFCLTDI